MLIGATQAVSVSAEGDSPRGGGKEGEEETRERWMDGGCGSKEIM